ncbi:MAG: DNA adenine methylase [Bryobacterales bacterium]|nr:DNA adenine methylase [Bryobacterales bacterium]
MTVRYLGGKSRLGKKIAAILNPMLEGGAPYYEPFCGACNVAMHIRAGRRYLSDAHPQLIAMWKAVQNGWVPPDTVTEADYAAAKRGELPPELTAFIGFGCSFGGKWFGGYARGGEGRSYASNAKNSIARRAAALRSAEFRCEDYSRLVPPQGSVVYCDPPYASTTGYGGVGEFDSARFWEFVRRLSGEGVMVVVSEYSAPGDFACIAELPTKLDMRDAGGKSPRIERLFTYAKARN